MAIPSADNTIVGKIGTVYAVAYGTTPPFTLPPPGSLDIMAMSPPAGWLAGNLGYLHEDDTPEFTKQKDTQRISAWQLNGQTLRVLQSGQVRTIAFTAREWNRNTWALLEPGTTYTAGVNGTTSLSIPVAGSDPPKAWLIEVQDLDLGMKLWWYVPKASVTQVGGIKLSRTNTANIPLTLEFEQDAGATQLYYVVANHDGFA